MPIENTLDREEKIMAEWVECTIGDLCDTISDTYKGNDENVGKIWQIQVLFVFLQSIS